MKIKRILILLICLAFAFGGASCKKATPDVVFIYKGSLKDGYMNQYTHEGLKSSCELYGLKLEEIQLTEESGSELDVTEVLAKTPGLAVFAGEGLENICLSSAKNFPAVNFALVGGDADGNLDGVQDAQNIYSIVFRREQAGFLSGLYAACKSVDSVGFVGKYEYLSYIEYEAGFTAGIKSVNKDLEIVKFYRGDETDDAVSFDALASAIANCDIIYTIDEADYIYNVAGQLNIPVIGAVYNYRTQGMDFIVKEDILSAVNAMMEVYYNGLMKGQIARFGLGEGALSESYAAEDQSVADVINLWKNLVVGGIVKVPTTRTGAAQYVSPIIQ
ncbi:MAG: BMP family ABC transporter substrate-binding protein [Eubacteriaceae bacterium]|nr:BMP family ABC transporter substrate-binding protein [Eubacteriaceae bacterium]